MRKLLYALLFFPVVFSCFLPYGVKDYSLSGGTLHVVLGDCNYDRANLLLGSMKIPFNGNEAEADIQGKRYFHVEFIRDGSRIMSMKYPLEIGNENILRYLRNSEKVYEAGDCGSMECARLLCGPCQDRMEFPENTRLVAVKNGVAKIFLLHPAGDEVSYDHVLPLDGIVSLHVDGISGDVSFVCRGRKARLPVFMDCGGTVQMKMSGGIPEECRGGDVTIFSREGCSLGWSGEFSYSTPPAGLVSVRVPASIAVPENMECNKPMLGIGGMPFRCCGMGKDPMEDLNIEWFYTWSTDVPGYRLIENYGNAFVPMVKTCEDDISQLDKIPNGWYVLFLNEPDYSVPCEPGRAAEFYHSLVEKRPDLKFIVGGVVSDWGNWRRSFDWLESFENEYKNRYGTDVPMAGMHIHIYPARGCLDEECVVNDMKRQLEEFLQWKNSHSWAGGELWITETGTWYYDYRWMPSIITDWLGYLSTREDVDRVAWFIYGVGRRDIRFLSTALVDYRDSRITDRYYAFRDVSSRFKCD